MKETLIQLQIYYEIAMSIGNNPDLGNMLKESLAAYLRKLDCSAGAVIRLQEMADASCCFIPLFSIPRNLEHNSTYQAALKKIPGHLMQSQLPPFRTHLPIIGSDARKKFYHIMELPDFGLLILLKHSSTFTLSVLKSLMPLNEKLARSCISCLQQQKIETVVEQLKKENHERKRFEEALKESEQLFRSVFEAAPHGISIITSEGKFLNVNKTFYNLLGYSKDDLKLISFLDITHPDDREKIKQLNRDIQDNKYNFYKTKKRCIRKDGQVIFTIIRGSAIRDGKGILEYWLCLIEDITKQQQAEEKRKELEARLQQSQKLEAIGTLAGGIAHDFNNLLMGVQGRTSLMKMDIEPNHPSFEHLLAIEEYVESASKLTKQLLGLARGGKYELKPVDLNQIIEKSSELFGRTRKDIVIHKKFQENIWTVEVDVSQIEQVLLNLYVNAWQAMAGTGELYLKTKNVVLNQAEAKSYGIEPGQFVKISVRDRGIGIDQQIRHKIFDPFFTTKEMGRGTGLGLASAYGIIKNHGGTIQVSSQKREGTTFHIYLPTSKKQIPVDKKPEEDLLTGKETILLVDDEAMIREVGEKMLTRLGYHVLLASDGKKATELYSKKQNQVDLIILDLIMPKMGGEETYVKLQTINPQVKVLLSSGYSMDSQTNNLLNLGCKGFIQKPFRIHQLSQKVREILGN
ncbi:MAG: PAS domain S-box protein [Candidatus Aminicenantes bacterium]|jgi:PAS domain S-box-containing protein